MPEPRAKSIHLSSVVVSLAQRTGGDVIMIIFISNFPKRYEKMIGERNFEHYARQRKEFGPLCKNVEDFYPTSKKEFLFVVARRVYK